MSHREAFEEKKVWGHVKHLFFADECAISYLQVEKNSYCSIHKHEHRTNVFYLLSGNVAVLEFGNGPTPTTLPIKAYILKEQTDTVSIPKGVWHQFQVKESGSLIEIYHGTHEGDIVRHEDIVRHTVGGVWE